MSSLESSATMTDLCRRCWFYLKDETQEYIGPCHESKLARRFQSGKIDADTLVWNFCFQAKWARLCRTRLWNIVNDEYSIMAGRKMKKDTIESGEVSAMMMDSDSESNNEDEEKQAMWVRCPFEDLHSNRSDALLRARRKSWMKPGLVNVSSTPIVTPVPSDGDEDKVEKDESGDVSITQTADGLSVLMEGMLHIDSDYYDADDDEKQSTIHKTGKDSGDSTVSSLLSFGKMSGVRTTPESIESTPSSYFNDDCIAEEAGFDAGDGSYSEEDDTNDSRNHMTHDVKCLSVAIIKPKKRMVVSKRKHSPMIIKSSTSASPPLRSGFVYFSHESSPASTIITPVSSRAHFDSLTPSSVTTTATTSTLSLSLTSSSPVCSSQSSNQTRQIMALSPLRHGLPRLIREEQSIESVWSDTSSLPSTFGSLSLTAIECA